MSDDAKLIDEFVFKISLIYTEPEQIIIEQFDSGPKDLYFVGKGYWVWFIPLSTGATSVGIVADPQFHELDTFRTFERALEWLRGQRRPAFMLFHTYEVHEPLRAPDEFVLPVFTAAPTPLSGL